MLQETSDTTFNKDVLESSSPVLVDFWAPWCGPCQIAGPIMERVSDKATGKAKVYKLNIDENPGTTRDFNITGIPTVLVFKNGKIDTTFVGVQPENVYLKAIGL